MKPYAICGFTLLSGWMNVDDLSVNSLVVVKLRENWLRIYWEIREIHSPRLMQIRVYQYRDWRGEHCLLSDVLPSICSNHDAAALRISNRLEENVIRWWGCSHTRHCTILVLRRWPNIKPTLGRRLLSSVCRVYAEILELIHIVLLVKSGIWWLVYCVISSSHLEGSASTPTPRPQLPHPVSSSYYVLAATDTIVFGDRNWKLSTVLNCKEARLNWSKYCYSIKLVISFLSLLSKHKIWTLCYLFLSIDTFYFFLNKC